jgi:hypothetical protein
VTASCTTSAMLFTAKSTVAKKRVRSPTSGIALPTMSICWK